MNLQDSLLKEYQCHPAFAFNEQSWVVPRELVDSFNKNYHKIYTSFNYMSKNIFKAHALECEHILAELFTCLSTKTSNDYDLKFIRELGFEAKRWMLADLNFLKLSAKRQVGLLSDDRSLAYNIALREHKYFYGKLSNETLKAIWDVAAPEISRLRRVSANASTREELSVNTGPVIRRICRILNSFYSQAGIIDSVSAYTGCCMYVSGAALELSIPQTQWWAHTLDDKCDSPKTLYAHFDESRFNPKSIVYLTDVTPERGPTSIYPGIFDALNLSPLQDLIGRVLSYVGSHPSSSLYEFYSKRYHQSMSSENFRRHFMLLPNSMKFNSHFGWDILPNGIVEKFLLAQERSMLGEAGTFIIFDGSCLLHRGGLIHSDERVALQIMFSRVSLIDRVNRKFKNLVSV